MKMQHLSLMRSLFNNGSSKTNMLSTMKQLSQYNQLSKGTMKKPYEKLDTVEISPSSLQKQVASKQRITSRQAIQSLTHLQGKEVKEIKAKNNVLEFDDGALYRFSFNGVSTVMQSFYHGSGSILGTAFTELGERLGVDTGAIYSQQDVTKINKIEDFFSGFTGRSGLIGSRHSYSGEEVLDMFKSVGIEPGWFTVKSSGQTVRHYLREDGRTFSEKQVLGSRNTFMSHNLFDIGYKQGEKITIGDTDYEVDETGHINLPPDAAVFLTHNVDPMYTKRKQLATIKDQLIKTQATRPEEQVFFSTPTHDYTLDGNGELLETKNLNSNRQTGWWTTKL